MSATPVSKLKYHLIVVLILGISITCLGQSETNNFEFYGLDHGLKSLQIGDIVQDHKGFLWFGSGQGLSRLDGNKFKVYENDPSNQYSISTNSISKILIDRNGNMWVSTNGRGINFYQRELDRFIRILHISGDSSSLNNDYVNDIFEDQQGNIWVATQEGLNKLIEFDEENESARFQRFAHLPHKNIICLEEFPKGNLWMGTGRNGLLHMDLESHEIISYRYSDSVKNRTIPSDLIKSFFREGDDYLWVCTSFGLGRIYTDSENKIAFTSFIYSKDSSSQIPVSFIQNMIKTSENEYWMSTFNQGLLRMEWSKETEPKYEKISKSEGSTQSLESNFTTKVFIDKSENLWVSSNKGINKISLGYLRKNRSAFQHFQIPQPNDGSAKDVLSLFEDDFGNIWAGSYGLGLYIYHKKSEKWIRFKVKKGALNRLSNSVITTIDRDKDGVYWIGTFGGLNKVKLHWNEKEEAIADITWFVPKKGDPNSLPNKRVFAVHDQDSVLWVGTRGGGLSKFNKQSGKFKVFKNEEGKPNSISNNYVWSIEEDSQHRLWLATDNGINIFEPSNEHFFTLQYDPSNPNGLANNLCNIVMQDSKGRMWIGYYTNGLSVVYSDKVEEGKTLNLTHLRQSDGLNDQNIYGILEDQYGYLWISTPKGISRFDASSWEPGQEIPSNAFQAFTKKDGLQENEFNSGAYHINGEGWVYFGGINGFNKFHPKEISRNTLAPPVFITGVKIMNQPIHPGQKVNKHIPLSKNPIEAAKLRLTHKDLILNIEFTSLNYIFTEKNQYAYKLEGFDQDWIYAGNESKASYTNLREGKYTFKVKASNNDGVWNEEGASMAIFVSPPPWRSWWAYLVYLVLAVAIISTFIRYRIRSRERELETKWRIQQAKLEEREVVRKNAAADFHDELGNKITKITLFAELAKRQIQLGKETESFLDKIGIQSRELSEGIRDFIWILDPEQDSFYKLFNRAKEFGDQLFEHTLIDFRVKGISDALEEITVSVSTRRHLMMIIKEALHNVLKYSEAKTCTLDIKTNQTGLNIRVIDDGKGFILSESSGGYGLKNMASRAEKIGADFSINSQANGGTQIDIKLKYPK
ncbi:MAG: hypothetical protein MRZ79_14135 [Bacteroidia bacterium]|nr:hypothetical protein [Bacteroidia bacterium]